MGSASCEQRAKSSGRIAGLGAHPPGQMGLVGEPGVDGQPRQVPLALAETLQRTAHAKSHSIGADRQTASLLEHSAQMEG